VTSPLSAAKSVAVAVNLNDHVEHVDVGVVGDGDGDDLSPAPGRPRDLPAERGEENSQKLYP
jgi:hypothetical protein